MPAAKLLLLPTVASSSFLANGFRGVDLFFILSGFILMRASGHEFSILDWRVAARFELARIFRIYPLNTVVLLAMVPLVLLAPGFVSFSRAYVGAAEAYKLTNLSWPGFVQSFLLVQTFTVAKLGEWNGPCWSLSAELLGYILFPLLAFALLKQRNALLLHIGAGLCLGLLTGMLIAGHHANNNPTGLFGAVRMLFCFTAGMLAHRGLEVGRTIGPKGGSALTIIAIGLIALTLIVPRFAVLANFGFLMMIVGLAHGAGPVDRLMRSRLFMWLGAISFSFYMVQETLFRIFIWAFEPALLGALLPVRWLSFAAIILVIIVTARVLYTTVEKPSHVFCRRLTERKLWQTAYPDHVDLGLTR